MIQIDENILTKYEKVVEQKKLWNNQVMILNNPMNRKPCNCAICPETHLVDLQAGKYI